MIKITEFKKIEHLTPNGSLGTGASEPDLFEVKYINENNEESFKRIWIDIWYFTADRIKGEFIKCMRNAFRDNYNFDEVYDMYLNEIVGTSCPYSKEEILNSGLYK